MPPPLVREPRQPNLAPTVPTSHVPRPGPGAALGSCVDWYIPIGMQNAATSPFWC